MAAHTADEYMNSEKWVGRVKQAFDMMDFNKNGYIEEGDWKAWVENIKKDVNPDAGLLEKLTKALTDYSKAMGATPGTKMDKDQYVKAMSQMAAADSARKAKGEPTLGSICTNAWQDVVDTNHDGTVTLDEFRKVMKACNVKQEIADVRFNAIDTNKNGKIERKELIEHEEKYWLGLD